MPSSNPTPRSPRTPPPSSPAPSAADFSIPASSPRQNHRSIAFTTPPRPQLLLENKRTTSSLPTQSSPTSSNTIWVFACSHQLLQGIPDYIFTESAPPLLYETTPGPCPGCLKLGREDKMRYENEIQTYKEQMEMFEQQLDDAERMDDGELLERIAEMLEKTAGEWARCICAFETKKSDSILKGGDMVEHLQEAHEKAVVLWRVEELLFDKLVDTSSEESAEVREVEERRNQWVEVVGDLRLCWEAYRSEMKEQAQKVEEAFERIWGRALELMREARRVDRGDTE